MVLALTICSANYLAFAKSLADSYVLHNPGHSFVIVLLDEYNEYDPSAFLPHTIMPVSTLQIEAFEEMNNRYDIFELSCALKPFVLEYFLKQRPQLEAVYYFDSDILVYGSLHYSNDILQNSPIVITPHAFTPFPVDGLFPSEEVLLRSGVYNAGFIGINQSAEAAAFLTWWKERMLTKCFNDVANGLFVDQLWLEFVPIYFSNTHILQHPGYNVAYWNFHERELTYSEETGYSINEKYPLVFFHYSGYDIQLPEVVSKHQDRFTMEDKAGFKPLFEKYVSDVVNNRIDQFSSLKPVYGIVKPPPIIEKKKKRFFLFK